MTNVARKIWAKVSVGNFDKAYETVSEPFTNDASTTGELLKIIESIQDVLNPSDELLLLLAALQGKIGCSEKCFALLLDLVCGADFKQDLFYKIMSNQIFISENEFFVDLIERSLKKFPNEVVLVLSLVTILEKNGNKDDALSRLEVACKAKPKDFRLHLRAAQIYLKYSDYLNAGNSYLVAYNHSSENIEIIRGIAQCFRYSKQFAMGLTDDTLVLKLISEPGIIRPEYICASTCAVLRNHSDFWRWIKICTEAESKDSISKLVDALSNNLIFNKLLVVSPIHDVEIEQVLTKLRFYFLLYTDWFIENQNHLRFFANLCIQCQINEFVFFQTDKEVEAVNIIVDSLRHAEKCNWVDVVRAASYCHLLDVDIENKLDDYPLFNLLKSWLIKFPNMERNLRSNIPSLGDLSDKVSQKVAAQYEQFPYPRWVTIGSAKQSVTIKDVIEAQGIILENRDILNSRNPRILIAGCGTGRHAIDTSNRYKNAEITAIDLSLNSLAYAKRKTLEAKIDNINYIQGDILSLNKLEQKFDLIEAVGVLHHMRDPVEGLNVLVKRSTEGGLLRIGLYSRRARSNISNIREAILNKGVKVNKSFIRDFRRLIALKGSSSGHQNLLKSADFYSMSSVKDLLFHEKEHTFDLVEIKQILDGCGLKFCGFQDMVLVNTFKNYFGDSHKPIDLLAWEALEEKFPNIFSGMYQFWSQKISL